MRMYNNGIYRDMTEEEEGQSRCHGEAGYVKGDFDF